MDKYISDYLADRYTYDPESGLFYNKSGKAVGSYTRKYSRLFTKYGTFSLSRLAYFLMEGSHPDGEMDHIDGDTHNNKWDNLRCCTRSENAKNRRAYSSNTSGYKGVYSSEYKGKTYYHSSIQSDNKRIYLGGFETPEKAAQAYNEAALKHHGDFATLNDIEENYLGT